jgi:tRNA threonylcarbamoyladenosine biosynthesis protein TsaE
MKQVSRSLEETKDIATSFLKTLKPSNSAVIVALHGDLGAGKTAFVKKCAEHFGIQETIISPTFVIEKIYKIPHEQVSPWKHIVHIDAYRFEDSSELRHLGFEEVAKDADNLIFIEWPERIKEFLPKETINIYLKFVDEESREINIED